MRCLSYLISFFRGPALRRGIFAFATALTFASCEGPAQPRQVPFNEADFAWTRNKGTGVVAGQAFIVMKDNSVRYGSKSAMVVFPVNAATTEDMQRRFVNGEHLEDYDDRAARYFCDQTADGEGRFHMSEMAPGEYYVGAIVNWNYWYYNDDGSKYTVYKGTYIYARVTVHNGQTTTVTDWNQGADKTY